MGSNVIAYIMLPVCTAPSFGGNTNPETEYMLRVTNKILRRYITSCEGKVMSKLDTHVVYCRVVIVMCANIVDPNGKPSSPTCECCGVDLDGLDLPVNV